VMASVLFRRTRWYVFLYGIGCPIAQVVMERQADYSLVTGRAAG
jgi:hypothetical protein